MRTTEYTQEEFIRRSIAANEEIRHVLQPHIDWLAKTDLMFGKATIVHHADGRIEIEKVFPADVQMGIDKMNDLIEQTKKAIIEYHFP